MNYWEFEFELKPRLPWSEILIAGLAELQFESFEDTNNGLKAYIQEELFSEEEVKNYLDNFHDEFDCDLNYTQNFIPQQNWNATWEAAFDPVILEDDLVIKAPFHDENLKGRYTIIIEPKMSFGTGHHQTTRLMASALLKAERMPSDVLDMGCGTGVLAILAEKLGAKNVTAIDNEQWAYENTVENAERNGCQNVQSFWGDAALLGASSFDLILANINKNVLLADMAKYVSVLNSNGLIFFSGFFESDNEALIDCAKKLNLALLEKKQDEGWSCLSFRKVL